MKANNSYLHPISQLSTKISSLNHEQIPDRFYNQVKLSIIDTLGVALLANSIEDFKKMTNVFLDDCKGSSSIWWDKRKSSTYNAAFLNSFAAHYFDFDNILYSTFGHPNVMILPALFAIFDSMDFSGKSLLDAAIVGYETMALIGTYYGNELKNKGYHPTPIIGGLGTTAALSWILNFDEIQIKSALTLTGTTLSGFKSSFGSMAKSYQVATSTRESLISVLTLKNNRELQLEEKWIENLELISGKNLSDSEINKRFADPWELDALSFMYKFYPSCGYFHHAMNELNRIIDNSKVNRKKLKKVHLILPNFIKEADIYSVPNSFKESQFSFVFNIALIIAFEPKKQLVFKDEHIKNSEIFNAMKKVEIDYIEDRKSIYEDLYYYGWANLVFEDGTVINERMILTDNGSDVTLKQIKNKFERIAQTILTQTQIDNFIDLIMNFEHIDSAEWRSFLYSISHR